MTEKNVDWDSKSQFKQRHIISCTIVQTGKHISNLLSVDGKRICTNDWFKHYLFHFNYTELIELVRERGGLVVERLDSESRGLGFDPHKGHRVLSLSRTLIP